MNVLRPASQAVIAIAFVSAMTLLASMTAAAPAAARVASRKATSDRLGAHGKVKSAQPGARRWVSFYTGPGAHDDISHSVAVSRRGSAVFVTGPSSSDHVVFDYATVGYNAATGQRLWARRYTGTQGAGGGPAAVAIDPAGNRVFVTGESPRPISGSDYVTIAYSEATGARLWLGRYEGLANGNDFATAEAVSPDGSKVFVTGSSQGDYATVAYDAATGSRLWVSRYSSAGNFDDVATSLAVSKDGSAVYVTGGTEDQPDYATVA